LPPPGSTSQLQKISTIYKLPLSTSSAAVHRSPDIYISRQSVSFPVHPI
jgi:hypothetical protein